MMVCGGLRGEGVGEVIESVVSLCNTCYLQRFPCAEYEFFISFSLVKMGTLEVVVYVCGIYPMMDPCVGSVVMTFPELINAVVTPFCLFIESSSPLVHSYKGW